MRSKRKEVNKFGFRAAEQLREEQEDPLHRSTGIKPFQLVKLRQGQRSSFDLAHTHNEILHRRTGSNNLYAEEKEVCIDLVIKQKLIVDAQANQKLESERKNIVSLEQHGPEEAHRPEKRQAVVEKSEEELLYSQSSEAYCVQPSHQTQQNTQEQTTNPLPKRKRNKCQCCLQLDNATHAIIRHKHQEHLTQNAQTEEWEQKGEEKAAAEEVMRELKTMKQKALPPFSFTSTKWRSKSQILQVDKWKERYGRDMRLTQKLQLFEKTVSQKQRHPKGDLPTYQSAENHKSSLPILHRSKELQSKAKIFKHSPSKQQAFRIYNPEKDSHPYLLLNEAKKEGSGKRHKQQTEEKIQIAIKKMYDSEEKAEEQPQLQTVETAEQPVLPEKEKPKRKKSKFPQIQISTFYSSKQEADERKRIRIENIQRLAREWRLNPPKKVCLQKIMEEIPQRWEYGESRQSSRQVDDYLQHQQEEAKKLQEEAKKLQFSEEKPFETCVGGQ